MGGLDRSSETIGRSSVREVRLTDRRADGAPVYGYARVPGVPPVGIVRLPGAAPRSRRSRAHAHAVLVLAYLERGGGTLRVGAREWATAPGDVFLIAPGEVLGPGFTAALGASTGWTVFFPPDVLEPRTPGALVSSRSLTRI